MFTLTLLLALTVLGSLLDVGSVKVKVGMILPKDDPVLKPKIGFGTSAGALTIALNRVKEEHLLDDVDWEIIWKWPECEESLSMGMAIELMEKEDVDVIIGPACSLSAILAGILGKYYNTPLVSWAATDPKLDDRIRFPTFSRVCPSATALGRAIMDMLLHFEWDEYAMLYADDGFQRYCYYIYQGFLERQDVTQGVRSKLLQRIDGASPTDQELDDFILQLPEKARIVFICLDRLIDRRRFLLRVHEAGLILDEYVFIFPEDLPEEKSLWKDEPREHEDMDGLDVEAYQVARHSFTVEWDTIDTDELINFKREVPRIMSQWPFYYRSNLTDELYGSKYSPFLHDAMYMYARALNLTLEAGKSKEDGLYIIQQAKTIRFQGKSGNVAINKFASRDPDFQIRGMNRNGDFVPMIKFQDKGGQNTVKVTMLESEAEIWRYKSNQRPPTAIPKCGYEGVCLYTSFRSEKIIIFSGIAVFCLAVLIGAAVYLRSSRISKYKENSLWRINRHDLIEALSPKGAGASPAAASMSSMSTMDDVPTMTNNLYALYLLKGTPVLGKRHLQCFGTEITKEDKREFIKMKEFQSDNLCTFLGLIIEGDDPMSVWQLAGKGSLHWVLHKDSLTLDWYFKHSLIKDLAQGLQFLHSSSLGSHGRLNSFTCLIDNRWLLKISDYGLTCFREREAVSLKDQIWCAPELLRAEKSPMKGTPEGDIYSFGVILCHMMMREEPFTDGDATEEVLIYRIRKGERPPLRPTLCLSLDENQNVHAAMTPLIQDCWDEDPKNRPTIKAILTQLKGMVGGKPQFHVALRSTSLMGHVLEMMEKYAASLEKEVTDRTQQLIEEQKKCDLLLHRMLPKAVAEKLKTGINIEPESFESVTIFFSDVVGFTTIANLSTPMQVVWLLNELYVLFDGILDNWDVYKVETIGDGLLCVSGLPHRNGDTHAGQIASMAIAFQHNLRHFTIPHLPKYPVKLRIGVHTGPCTAGIVGLTMPRYCLFGDSVNTASRMESHGKPECIHITEETNTLLVKKLGCYTTKERGEIIVKGKGVMKTFWLVGKDGTDSYLLSKVHDNTDQPHGSGP